MDFKNKFQDTPAESGFSLIDVGTYEAEIMDCQLDLTKEPPRLSLTIAITQEPFEGRKVFTNYQLEGRGLGFLKKDLDTLGLRYDHVGSEEDIATLIWDAMPMPVVIYVAQKEWQGKVYNNAYINELIGERPAALETTPPPPGPTNQKEADRQQRVAAQDSKAPQAGQNQTSRTQAGATKPAATAAPAQRTAPATRTAAKPGPKNHAPTTTRQPAKRPPAGEPNFEDAPDGGEMPF